MTRRRGGKIFRLPEPWFHVAVGPRRLVPVYLVPFECFHGHSCNDPWEIGIQWPFAGRRKTLNFRRTLVHEWIHLWFRESGVGRYLARILPPMIADDVEEKIVSLLEPVVTKSLKRHGMQFPEPPEAP